MGEETKNNIIELNSDIVKLLDSTNISSLKDVYNAFKHTEINNPGTILNTGVEVLGTMPIIGKLIKSVKTASSLDNVLLGGEVKKRLASRIAHNSGGMASIITPLFAMLPINASYNGWTKANDPYFESVKDKPDVINLMLYGDSKGFTPYSKKITLNGDTLQNVYYAKLYPEKSIIADKKLKGTIQQANAENFHKTKNDTPIIDSHKFRMSFKPKYVRASDAFDFNPYTLSGRLMHAAAKPTWKYPNAGIPTFVQEIPVKYVNKSDLTLKTALKNE